MAFLGGTIGNLLPGQRAAFLASLRARLRPGDALLLGTDLVKDPDVLLAAYDDAAGVTAAFNKNMLSVLNAAARRELRPRPRSTTSPCGMPARSGSRCACGQRRSRW